MIWIFFFNAEHIVSRDIYGCMQEVYDADCYYLGTQLLNGYPMMIIIQNRTLSQSVITITISV